MLKREISRMLTVIPKRLENLEDGRSDARELADKRGLSAFGLNLDYAVLAYPERGYLVARTCRGLIVRVVYSDESGVGNIDKEPITVVTAIVINMDRDWKKIESDLRKVQAETPFQLLENQKILKGRLLYSALRKGDSAAEQALKEILAIPVRYRCAIFHGAVDRKGLLNYQQTPNISDVERSASSYTLAFSECLATLDNMANTFTDERLLWIAERSDKEREPATKEALQYYRWKQGLKVLDDHPDDQPLSVIADTVYFGNPTDSLALQLADVCCSTITNYLLEQFYGRDYCVTDFYERIRQNVGNHATPILLREFKSA